MKYTVAEFFSGCGGFSRGFARTGRFNVVLGNDVKAEALKSFAFNHSENGICPSILREDIRTLKVTEIKKALSLRGIGEGELDCMIGGPPCQGFSQMRRTELREEGKVSKFRGYSQLSNDPRNDLVLRYLDVAEALRPKVLLIENVPQMLNHGFDGRLGKLSEIVIDMLEKDLGYSVKVAVINCADYGVPQLRERAVFIATSVGTASFPSTTHANPNDTFSIGNGKLPWVTVGDAIRDLPPPSHILETLGGQDKSIYVGVEGDFAKIMRTSSTFPYNHITRSYRKSVLNIIKEMRPGYTWAAESERMRKNYETIIDLFSRELKISQADARKNLEKNEVINPVFFKNYYWSAYSRLTWEEPALTITANANFLGSGQFSHPIDDRGITMREAARLQSFDDDFRFITSNDDKLDTTRIGVGMDMIGEAVPPLLAEVLANHLANQLDAHRETKEINDNKVYLDQ